MNFEYKVGYLWKSLDEVLGQEKLKRRKTAQTARTDGEPPERIFKIVLPTVLVKLCFLEIFLLLFGRLILCLGRTALQTFHFLSFFSFSSFSLYLSFSPNFLSLLEWEKGCPLCVWGISIPRIKELCTGEVFRACRTAAGQVQNSVSEDSSQIQTKIL